MISHYGQHFYPRITMLLKQSSIDRISRMYRILDYPIIHESLQKARANAQQLISAHLNLRKGLALQLKDHLYSGEIRGI